MHRTILLGLIILSVTFSGCGPGVASLHSPTDSPTELTVFAAASLHEAFTELAAEFETTHPETTVLLNFAGSQSLRLQIEQGASVDVFASANPEQMQTLLANELMNEPAIFTHNRLAVITPVDNSANISTLTDLTQPDLKLVLAGANVPAGRYARIVLDNLNLSLGAAFSRQVLANLVSEEENVKSVVAKVQLGEADAGMVYLSDVSPAVQDKVRIMPIPDKANVQAAYPLAVATHATDPDLAQQFAQFVLSSRGQTLLAQHGFNPSQVPTIGQQP